MKQISLILAVFLALSGCKVGPNYTTPYVAMPDRFVEEQAGDAAARSDESLADESLADESLADEDLVHWWKDVFKDPFLDQLMERALGSSFDLAIAVERVLQARANYWVQFASILPAFEMDAQATRFRTSQSFASVAASPVPLSPIQNFFQIGLDAIWQIDLFGKLRRNAESAYDLWEASIEEERGVKISVLSEVASLYVTICYFQTKVDLAEELVQLDEGLVLMSKERFQSGLAGEEEVYESLSAFEADQSALLILQTSLKQNIYSLAVLLGQLPKELLSILLPAGPCPFPLAKSQKQFQQTCCAEDQILSGRKGLLLRKQSRSALLLPISFPLSL